MTIDLPRWNKDELGESLRQAAVSSVFPDAQVVAHKNCDDQFFAFRFVRNLDLYATGHLPLLRYLLLKYRTLVLSSSALRDLRRSEITAPTGGNERSCFS